ncbi:MAG: sulfatase [Verrucomicrobia bacterium]|nr:sulfatase [Verrucomicrobiota bacterium]MDA1065741.1 sulfatase [Verrucomicrobiota bacterium]
MNRCLNSYLISTLILLSAGVNAFAQAQNNPDPATNAVIAPQPELMAKKQALLSQIKPVTGSDKRPPNIVLLFADDLGYADTAVYGSKTIPTPHIDALAKRGIRFTDAYVTAGTCSPSRAGMMSGNYQQRYGFEFNTSGAAETHQEGRGLMPSAITMAEVLQKAGYATGMFGKWHLGTRSYMHPQERGFDEFYGFLAGAHSFMPEDKMQPGYQSILRGHEPIIEPEYLTDAIARETVDFINRKRDVPFFAYVPFNAVHTPIEATEKYQKRFPNEKNETQRDYNAMTSALDDAVGSIVDALEKHKLLDNTLVIFLDDNGGPIYTGVQSNGPLKLGKLFLFEGGVRVPMIVSWPAKLDAGKNFSRITSSLDVFPTVCAAAGIELPDALPLDGVDLLPHLKGENPADPHRTLFWSNGPNKAIRMGKWKLVKSGDYFWLYDLSKDIGETNNLATEKPDVLEILQGSLDEWLGQMPPPAWPSKPNRQKFDVDGIPYELNI